ncbi:Hypothetical predicted protein, partial [Pelobates cultripes]
MRALLKGQRGPPEGRQTGPATETPTPPEGAKSSSQTCTAQAAHQHPERTKNKATTEGKTSRPPTTSPNPLIYFRDGSENMQ